MAADSEGDARERLQSPAGGQGSVGAPDHAHELAAAGGDGLAVLEQLRNLPGGAEVLQLAARHRDVALVGGAVRDLLLGRTPREIDLVVASNGAAFPQAAAQFAHELASLLTAGGDPGGDGAGGEAQVSVHERFGTAVVCWGSGRVDIATRRGERYTQPGALPEVGPAEEEQDLRRRDFTVNAIAVGLGGSREGVLSCAPGAVEDLRAGRLRILHSRSFEDDPTRLMRLARYSARLGFAIEPRTAELAGKALQDRALSAVSDARVGAELRLALSEPDVVASLLALRQLGVLGALQPPMALEPQLLERALRLLPGDGRRDLLALGCLLLAAATARPAATGELEEPPDARDELLQALERWEQPASDRRPVIEAAMYAHLLGEEIADAESPSELWDLLCGVAIEAVALAGAVAEREGDPGARAAAESWLGELRHVRLAITGEDLLAAGVPEGPEIGERLATALRLRLDRMIDEGREAELRAALDR